ncbi:MAG TPA: hypothetical protein VFM18_14300 [Methanosarcina sp.]|nr:hypothetical protein [Methanosarcina sp.]
MTYQDYISEKQFWDELEQDLKQRLDKPEQDDTLCVSCMLQEVHGSKEEV